MAAKSASRSLPLILPRLGLDESGTLQRLREHRQISFPGADRNEGRVVKLTSDGTLVELASAADRIVLCSDLITIVSWH